MRLIIRSINKAKEGLVPVKREVTKNGKTFMQTFYVKPDTTPSAPSKPTPAESAAAPKREKPHYNMEDGFYVHFGQAAIRIPDEYVAKTLEYRGFQCVIAQTIDRTEDGFKFSGKYRMYELTTGLAVGSIADTPQRAENLGTSNLSQKSEEQLSGVLASSQKITTMDNVISDTDEFPADPPNYYYTEEELDERLKSIWKNKLDGEDGPLSYDQFREWAVEQEQVQNNNDVNQLETGDEWLIEQAVIEGIDYDDAKSRDDAISEIISEASTSNMFDADYDYETVADWGREYEDNLIYGITTDHLGTSSEYGNEWNAGDVIAYAIENDVDISTAQDTAIEATDEADEEYKGSLMEDLEFEDRNGKLWDSDDASALGDWVTGAVKSNREAAKAMFQKRREGMDADSESYSDVVAMVESHAAPYTEGTLYRGTSNRDWLTAEIGKMVPYGIASFSKSEQQARSFSTEVILVMDQSDDTESPIIGVDVNEVVEAADNDGFYDAMNDLNITQYSEEQELITICPALMVTRRENNYVWVKPMEMNLVQLMKSLFDDEVARLEATFDYPLHREPEGAFA